MEVSYSCGKPITKGDYVIYSRTGTIGKIVDFKTENNSIWAKVDSTNLWYKSNYLQAIDKIEEKKLERKSKDIREKIKRSKKLVDGESDISSELCDGGG